LIKNSFDRIVRVSNLASYAPDLLKIDFDNDNRPLFMDNLMIENPNSYLFKEDF
jgi:hypothetical protein